jgi:CheY-like chemotaxis protein
MTAKRRILIIEDERLLREAFTFLLRSEGFLVDTADNGKNGLAKLAAFQPDLILLDMLMPVMDGVAFLQEAKLLANYPSVKVLMLSNLSDPVSLEDVQDYGVTASILKADLSPADLAAVAKKTLSVGI